ncbi:MAG: hypothetical protein OQK79_12955 [Rhodanobacter sp.]|jgi:hypothetical protein|nr:hypothetical protein [Rhodanobacter sp.]
MTFFSLYRANPAIPSFATAPPDTIDHTASETTPPVSASPTPHLDFDLQPLKVPALDHYVALHEDNAYFRVH